MRAPGGQEAGLWSQLQARPLTTSAFPPVSGAHHSGPDSQDPSIQGASCRGCVSYLPHTLEGAPCPLPHRRPRAPTLKAGGSEERGPHVQAPSPPLPVSFMRKVRFGVPSVRTQVRGPEPAHCPICPLPSLARGLPTAGSGWMASHPKPRLALPEASPRGCFHFKQTQWTPKQGGGC